MKENQFAKFVRCDVIKESCHSLVKSDFYFQALHCRDIKGCQFFPDPKKTMTAFTFPLNHNLLVYFSTSFCSLLDVSTLHFEHGPLFQNRLPVPNLMARGARQTRLEVPPSLHHSNLNRAAVIAKAIKESVKKDSADVKDTLGRQKYNQGEVSRAMVGQVKLRN